LSLLGLAFVRMGHVTDAMPLLEQGVALSQELGVRAYLAAWMANLAEGLLADGRTERAQEVAKEALEVARASGERGHEAILLELSGRIAAQRVAPEIEEARRCFSAARLLAEEIGLRPLLAAIDFETAALLARKNDAPIARAQRPKADHKLAAELGMRGRQEQPEAEVTELGHIFIVSRSNPEMYEFLVNEFSEARRIQIVADRRLDNRPTPYDKDLRNWGLALVPSGERRAPPPAPAPGVRVESQG
jgi:tetratricopeptide (TPR) repeat protein